MIGYAAAASVLNLAGSYLEYKATKKAASQVEMAADMQRQAAIEEAKNTELQTAENVSRARVNVRRRLARLSADMSTSGFENQGSSEEVVAESAGALELQIADAARAGAMEAQNQRRAGDMAAWEGRVRAASMRQKSRGTLLSNLVSTGGAVFSLMK